MAEKTQKNDKTNEIGLANSTPGFNVLTSPTRPSSAAYMRRWTGTPMV